MIHVNARGLLIREVEGELLTTGDDTADIYDTAKLSIDYAKIKKQCQVM